MYVTSICLKKSLIFPKAFYPSLSIELSNIPASSAGINILMGAGVRTVTPHKRFSSTVQSALSIITVGYY